MTVTAAAGAAGSIAATCEAAEVEVLSAIAAGLIGGMTGTAAGAGDSSEGTTGEMVRRGNGNRPGRAAGGGGFRLPRRRTVAGVA